MNPSRLSIAVFAFAFAACSSAVTMAPSGSDAGIDAGIDAGPPLEDAGADDAQADAPSVPFLFYCDADAGAPVPDAGCPVIDPTTFGTCEATIGAGFDGNHCVLVDGCSPGAPGLFPNPNACALACAAAGQCDESKLEGQFDPSKPLEGQFCDDVEILGDFSTSALPANLCAVAPDMHCEGYSNDTLVCRAIHGFLTTADVAELCALSLLPQVKGLRCLIYL